MSLKFHKNFSKIFASVIVPIIVIELIAGFHIFENLIDDKKDFLLEKALTISNLISNVAKFDKKYSLEGEFNNNPEKATLSQIQSSFNMLCHKELQLEYLLGKIENNHIVYIAYSDTKPPSISLNNTMLAMPMREALEGKTGLGVLIDYKKEKVFASYTPIDGTNWGLVITQPYSVNLNIIYDAIAESFAALFLLLTILYFVLHKYNAKTYQKIQESEFRFQQLVESTNDFVWEVDKEGKYTYASHQIKELLGYESHEILGKTLFDFQNSDENKKMHTLFENLISHETSIVNIEHTFIHKDGHEVHLLSNGSPFYDNFGNLAGFRGIDKDITQIKIQEEKIKNLAYYDVLTGVANRYSINQRIKEELSFTLRNNTFSSLIFLDLDEFKIINDTYGHKHGDEVLKVVATRMLKSVRDFDIVARLGGDEFVILLRGAKQECEICQAFIENLLERLIIEINKPIEYKRVIHHVGVSIGVAIIPKDGKSLEEITHHADSAMYESKQSGKNRATFYTK